MNRREFLKKSLEGIIIGIPLIYGCSNNPINNSDSDFFQSDYYYYDSDGSKIYLKSNLSKYTVKFKDEISDDRKNDILLQNKLIFNLYDFPYNLNLISFSSNNIDYKKILENIPEIEFVSYSFITEYGTVKYLSNKFHVKFKSNVSIEDINLFNSKYNAKITGKYGTNEVFYLIEIPWNYKFNVIYIVKIYYKSGLVIWASPSFMGGDVPH